MDPARQLVHLSLSVADGVLSRTLDVVRLVDGLLVSSAQSNAVDARSSARESWPDEEPGDLSAAASALRSRGADAGSSATPARRAAARKASATRATATKTTAQKAAVKKAAVKKTPAKRAAATKTAAKTSTAKTTTAKKAPAQRASAKKTAKKTAKKATS